MRVCTHGRDEVCALIRTGKRDGECRVHGLPPRGALPARCVRVRNEEEEVWAPSSPSLPCPPSSVHPHLCDGRAEV